MANIDEPAGLPAREPAGRLDAPLVVLTAGVEILPPEHPVVEVVAVLRPFSTRRVYLKLEAGRTLQQILDELGIPAWANARVFIDDYLVPRKHWGRIKPRAGRRVTIRVVASGGDGNDDNKTMRIVLQVVIILVVLVLSIAFPYLTPLWVLLGAGLAFGINMLFPPPQPTMPRLSGNTSTESPNLTITGARNQAALYAPIPRVFGSYRVFPPAGAPP